jgi:hypothetical protein
MADEQQGKPVVCGNCLIVQYVSRAIVGRDDGIDSPVIVYIANSHSTPHPSLTKHVPRLRRDVYKSLASVMRQKHRLLIPELREVQFNCVQIMALSDE